MAQMVPETISKNAPSSEKYLFSIFRDFLPDDFMVWHNPKAENEGNELKEPDFVILSKSIGLLFVEAKGYVLNNIKGGDMKTITVERPISKKRPRPTIDKEKHPLADALRKKNDHITRLKCESILINPNKNSPHFGNLLFPFWHCAIWTNIRTSDLEKKPEYKDIFLRNSILLRDHIDEWCKKEPKSQAVIDHFQKIFGNDARRTFAPLTDDQVKTINGVLNPSVAIKKELAKQSSWNIPHKIPDNATIIKTLDLQQESIAKKIGDGHRVISGVAGSGKTLILISRAKNLLRKNPEARILVTCFNVTLAAHLRSKICGAQNSQIRLQQQGIFIRNYDSWAGSICYYGKKDFPGFNHPEDTRADLLSANVIEVLNQNQHLKYDAILVDETHLMHPSWLKTLTIALKDPKEGALLLVDDANQKLRKRRSFTWKGVGINVIGGGKSKILKENYRNTREILNSAWNILSYLKGENKKLDQPTFPIIEPNKAKRSGEKPKLILVDNANNISSLAIESSKREIQSGQDANQIAFLYHADLGRINQLYLQARKIFESDKIYWVSENQESKKNYDFSYEGIRLITTQSSLGLEFNSVYLLWGQDFDQAVKDKDIEQFHELYVAMTRAQDRLTIISTSTSIVGKLLEDNHIKFGLDLVK